MQAKMTIVKFNSHFLNKRVILINTFQQSSLLFFNNHTLVQKESVVILFHPYVHYKLEKKTGSS
jgi:hypothetical protein